MRIYIDEAGLFVPPNPPRSLFSLVLALIIPTAIEKDLFYEFLRLRDTWPNQNVEIKGSSLDESQAAQVISLVPEIRHARPVHRARCQHACRSCG
jgi:hypothetical protein